MSETHLRRNVPRHVALHPAVYWLLGGAVFWMVAACWLAFGGEAYTALQLMVVVAFALAFVVTPLVLGHLSPARKEERRAAAFRDWLDDEFETYTGDVRTRDATIMILVAPLAGAVGISAVGFVAWLASIGAL